MAYAPDPRSIIVRDEATTARTVVPAVALATAFSAASGYVVLLLAARTLGAIRYDTFAVYWAAFFALTTVVNGIAFEVTRALRAQSDAPQPSGPAATWPAAVGGLIGVALSVLMAVSALWWAPLVAGSGGLWAIALLIVGALLSTLQAVMIGALSGTGSWTLYALLLGGDALVRLVVVVAVMAAGASQGGLYLATVSGSALWVIMLILSSRSRWAFRLRIVSMPWQFLGRCLGVMFASAAMAIMLVGFPILLKWAFPHEPAALLGTLILAVTLTRAPLLMPLTFFNTAILVYFVDRLSRGPHALTAPIGVLGLVTMVLALGAYLIGSPLLALMGDGFDLGAAALAALVIGAGATAGLFITGPAVLARDRHTVYAIGWWISVVAAVGSLAVLPLDAVLRTATALVIGPVVGMLCHAWGVLTSS